MRRVRASWIPLCRLREGRGPQELLQRAVQGAVCSNAAVRILEQLEALPASCLGFVALTALEAPGMGWERGRDEARVYRSCFKSRAAHTPAFVGTGACSE